MQLTKLLTQKIAKLAHLNLTPQEIEKFTPQLTSILNATKIFQQLDLSKVPPTNQVINLENITRPDVSKKFPEQQKLIEMSPQPSAENQIRVPKSISK